MPIGEPDAVVGDLEGGRLAVAAPQHPDPGGPGVALDVGERLLGDAPHLPLLEDGQPGVAVAEQLDL